MSKSLVNVRKDPIMANSDYSVFVKEQHIDVKDADNAVFTTAYTVSPRDEKSLEEARNGANLIAEVYNDAIVTDFGFEEKLTIREWMEKEINGVSVADKRYVGRLYVPEHGLHLVFANLTGDENFMHLGTFSQQEFDGKWLNSSFFYGNLDTIKAMVEQILIIEESLWPAYKDILNAETEVA